MTRVLALSEQGAGDTIMMTRYLRPMWESGLSLTISVQPELVSWVASLGEGAIGWDVVATNDPLPEPCDYWIPMMSLPRIFGVVPPTSPPEPATRRIWREWMGEEWNPEEYERAQNHHEMDRQHMEEMGYEKRIPRVGLCWKGNPDQSNDKDRSAPENLFLEGVKTPSCDWVSLQYGYQFQPKDYLETANLIETLDAVVTVDTSVAHLAGTLGVPTIVIPGTAADWRYGVPRIGEEVTKSVWYPSMTIVRRRESSAWPEAIETVSKLLKEML